jgi:hypothetical protein
MALPKLDATPKYELTIPSTGETLKYRPFLVKEQKVLLIAFESQDPKQVLKTIIDCIGQCSDSKDVKKLATFDVDYIFTKIRSKSVGEISKVGYKCQSCEADMEVNINLEELEVKGQLRDNKVVDITDTIKINMKYPSYLDLINDANIFSEETSSTEKIFSTLMHSMDSIMTEEENINLKDESKEEIETFINSLTGEQFERISNFMDDLPKITYKKEHTCLSCNHENEIELEGLQDFFS